MDFVIYLYDDRYKVLPKSDNISKALTGTKCNYVEILFERVVRCRNFS